MTVSKPTFILLGGGLASATAASTLRAEGFDGRVIIVSDESHAPYSRPPLSKEVLRAEKPPEKTWLRPPAWYKSKDIELQLGLRAVAVDPRAQTVELGDCTRLAYDKLLIATGGLPRALNIPGADLPGVFFLRTLEDALALRDRLTVGAPVVVIGAGFIGAEVAASARKRGCKVTMLEVAQVPMGRALGPRIGEIYADVHRERGVDLRTGIGVERIEGHGRAQRVVTADGRVHEASVVVIGIGLVPDLTLAQRSGFDTANGIIVDEFCRTSVDNVFAAGDIAHHPNPFLGRRIRVEHWQNAQHQGAAAARNMLGQLKPFHEVPWVWSDQYEHNLQVVGLPDATADVVVRGDTARRHFSAFFLRQGRVTAALAVNRPEDVRVARFMIQHATKVTEDLLADVDVNLGDIAVVRA
jgi:3-phenylpropionate/trans-cinnamate dioxygenase ferredoxin reductase subunit